MKLLTKLSQILGKFYTQSSKQYVRRRRERNKKETKNKRKINERANTNKREKEYWQTSKLNEGKVMEKKEHGIGEKCFN